VGDLQLEFELPEAISISPRKNRARTPSDSLPLYAAGGHKLKIWPREQGVEADKPVSRALALVPFCNPIKQVTTHGDSRQISRITQFRPTSHHEYWRLYAKLINTNDSVVNTFSLCFWFNFIPIAIVGGLSHFEKGHSTTAERVWTMAWLICGMVLGLLFSQYFLDDDVSIWSSNVDENAWKASRSPCFVVKMVFLILLFAAPAIGGFVAVGQC
jgi:hypothetical protein